ncbi:unnamed protein product [Mytilus coruscus]|uniref:Uncharacterized protein n=1 Tax=Mytilus coruscus TaxID=42192 RepID=A0A6J8AXX1_MYTCO|nr:unnamed protein product [Mytilus coruscus]
MKLCHIILLLRCHHITGCINIQQENTEEVSVPVKDTSTVAEYNVIWKITSLSSIIQLFTFRGQELTVRVSARRITSTTEKPKAHDLGLNNRELIVYSVCAGSFLFVILLCTACQRRNKQIHGNLSRYQVKNKRSINIPKISLPAIPLPEGSGIYEVIDESSMADNPENVRDTICLGTEANEVLSQSDSSDYLTPYHAVDEYSNTCNSSDNTSISSATSNFNQHITADRQSISLSSNIQRSRSTYLNQYPPIVLPTDIDTQGYAFINYINDTDSSVPEEQTRESCVLNPYQSMVPDRDLHEYKSVHGCSDALGSSLADTYTTEIRANPNQDRKSDINMHENKSVNDTQSDTVSANSDMIRDDSFEKFETQNEENLSYVE